jgi:putative transposase
MSRRGNCWDNAVAESFFSSLKRTDQEETYKTRDLARADIFTLKCSTTGPGATVTRLILIPMMTRARSEDRMGLLSE